MRLARILGLLALVSAGLGVSDAGGPGALAQSNRQVKVLLEFRQQAQGSRQEVQGQGNVIVEQRRSGDPRVRGRGGVAVEDTTTRITADKRVNIFYYPIDTWADFTFFNFCMDRGAGHQLEDVRQGSYGPWVRAIEGIFKEEKFHIRHGEFWVKRLAEDPKTHDEAQETLNRWYIRTMNIFGRPGSAKNVLYRKYRLKLRDNDEVRQTFAREVAEKAGAVGLTLPEWTPVWDRLPEEAQIPG